ncbi:uncharacterized protein LOC128215844 [Mya arenaria]|uniref:uncharacterized protein LOC128215844 n=1 Tax=Mya arenaria TaxID=6604 RepID=UPI0022E11429|nr:uncharacterized protein LOC128215844 [Mya arenaria]
MASNISFSFNLSSDLIHDFECSPCKDEYLNSEAHFFCDECKKIYCKKCIEFHSKLFRTHEVLGKQDVSKWVGYVGLSPLEACDKHGDKKLELLCEDHDELCCHMCVSLTHRMCKTMTLISDVANGYHRTEEFEKVQSDVRQMRKELKNMQDNKERNVKSLEKDGNRMLTEIKTMRKNFNDMFDNLEKQTIQEMDSALKEHDDALKEDKSICNNHNDKLETYLKNMLSDKDRNTTYIAYKKCKNEMKEAENLLKDLSIHHDVKLAFQADPEIEEFCSRSKTLGKIFNQNDVHMVRNLCKYNVRINKKDQHKCCISGICELPGGEILIADHSNRKVKLLNSQYQLAATCHLSIGPEHMCHIDAKEVAVTLGDKGVQVITVAGNGTLNVSRKIQFPHFCLGISHHNGNLYIGALTAIYQYTMSGQLVKKIYEDKSAKITVNRFTVSSDGSKILIPATDHRQLITIDTSGNILSTFQASDKGSPRSVCVCDKGHMFLCFKDSHKVTQVDSEGKQQMAIKNNDSDQIYSIWFQKGAQRLIVGGLSNKVFAFEI